MHSYMQGPDYIRFRCSDYPRCRTFLKSREAEFETMQDGMISADFNLRDFLKAVEGRPSWEALHLTDQEATAAGRMLVIEKTMMTDQRQRVMAYIDLLTEFMAFLRSTIKFPQGSKKANPLFWQYWDSIDQKINTDPAAGAACQHPPCT